MILIFFFIFLHFITASQDEQPKPRDLVNFNSDISVRLYAYLKPDSAPGNVPINPMLYYVKLDAHSTNRVGVPARVFSGLTAYYSFRIA
jgi:hypothetical protein